MHSTANLQTSTSAAAPTIEEYAHDFDRRIYEADQYLKLMIDNVHELQKGYTEGDDRARTLAPMLQSANVCCSNSLASSQLSRE